MWMRFVFGSQLIHLALMCFFSLRFWSQMGRKSFGSTPWLALIFPCHLRYKLWNSKCFICICVVISISILHHRWKYKLLFIFNMFWLLMSFGHFETAEISALLAFSLSVFIWLNNLNNISFWCGHTLLNWIRARLPSRRRINRVTIITISAVHNMAQNFNSVRRMRRVCNQWGGNKQTNKQKKSAKHTQLSSLIH